MKEYDPLSKPNPSEWLALDEPDQIAIVTAYHRADRMEVPNLQVHVMVHVVVENQLAERIEVAREALERLMAEGVDRHEAIHAIGSVLLEHMQNLMREKKAGSNPHERYFEDLRTLTVETRKQRTI